MASKLHLAQSMPASSSPQISLADQLLSSRITLPNDPYVAFVVFTPTALSNIRPHESIELARRNILSRNTSAILLDSLLPSIHIGTNSLLYVFRISSKEHIAAATSLLASLSFDELTAVETSSFALQDLYPCSPKCSLLAEPCSSCVDGASEIASLHTSLLPRKPLRMVYSHFLEAVRIRLLNDVAEASTTNGAQRSVKRLKGGFLLGTLPSRSEWGVSWEYRVLSRPLLYCQLQIHLSLPDLIIHPLLQQTPFLPLSYSFPLPQGSPITLLPHGTPAYFLTHYAGPTSALSKQFKESLQGMGASGWDNPLTVTKPEYIIAWINVENKQGEDKGIICVYPTALCLSFVPSFSSFSQHGLRTPLTYIPELPAPLQPSPQMTATHAHAPSQHGMSLSQPATPSPSTLVSSIPVSIHTATHGPPSTIPTASSFFQNTSPHLSLHPHPSPFIYSPNPILPLMPTTAALRAFRTLTLSSSKDICDVAAEVGGYVDAVVRDRERERERLRRERENGASASASGSASASASGMGSAGGRTPGTTMPTPAKTLATEVPTPLPVTGSIVGPSQHATPTASSTVTQNFYPSPPQTNPPIVSAHLPVRGGIAPPISTMSTTTTVTSVPTPAADETSLPVSIASNPGQVVASTSASRGADGSAGYHAWSMPSQQQYMNMGMDMDMDMNFDMDMGLGMGMDFGDTSGDGSGGAGVGDARMGSIGMGMAFDADDADAAFTDDDFSFFDRPSIAAPVTRVVRGGASSGRGPGRVDARPGGEDMFADLSGPGPPPSASPPTIPSSLQTTFPFPQSHGNTSRSLLGQHASWIANAGPRTDLFTEGLVPGFVYPGGGNINNDNPNTSTNATLEMHSTIHPSAHARVNISASLLPPSPGPTPRSTSSISIPGTPTVAVHLESSLEPSSASAPSRRSTFDPIPFAPYHRALDGKYAVGKFSLPSPPEETDDIEEDRVDARTELPIGTRRLGRGFELRNETQTGHAIGKGWRSKYIAATDPRIGVVRKLIGVKRKNVFDLGGRDMTTTVGGVPGHSLMEKKLSSPSLWIREHEDWEKNGVIEDKKKGAEEQVGAMKDGKQDLKSEADEDDDEDAESDDDMLEDDESPVISRPSTPLPGYLPLGPTLLLTQFQHSELLPLSTPLRPPGAAVAPTNMITATLLASVPTPVSPAAMLGATSEKSKSLEAAAFTVATEVVENPLWAEAWRASSMRDSLPGQQMEVRLADVKIITKVMAAVKGLEVPLDVGTLFRLGSGSDATSGEAASAKMKPLQLQEAPLISVGKGDAVTQLLPTATRFWEKLGLGPRAGKKNGIAFVLYEDDGEQRQAQVEAWLALVIATYEGKHFGTFVPGKSSGCSKDGVLPLRFDSSFRKTLANFIASLPASQSSLVFFIVIPTTIMTFASPVLRQVFSAIKKAAQTYSEAQIHFQFVPEQLIRGNFGNPSTDFSGLEMLCGSVYNRMLLPVDRVMSRRFFEHGERVRKYFQEPTTTLARPTYSKVAFTRAGHAPLDVVDRATFVHVGYAVSGGGRWLVAACIDQRGEGHDLGVWMIGGASGAEDGEADTEADMDAEGGGEVGFVVRKVWEFVVQFAKRANLEWRVVVAKLGAMGEGELEAWASFIETHLATSHDLRVVHVTLLSVEPDAPWTFCTTSASSASSPFSALSRPGSKPSPTKPPPQPARSASTSKLSNHHHPQNIFTDITTTISTLAPYSHLPQSLPPSLSDLGVALSCIYEPPASVDAAAAVFPSASSFAGISDQNQVPHPLPLRPLSSTALICIPASSPSPTAISMITVHLLHIASPPTPHSIHARSDRDVQALHTEITRNFYELGVLAGLRWRMGNGTSNAGSVGGGDGTVGLPFHLAAVRTMGGVVAGVGEQEGSIGEG